MGSIKEKKIKKLLFSAERVKTVREHTIKVFLPCSSIMTCLESACVHGIMP